MNYFISDTHFGHKNIIGYDNRPFKSTDEMDDAITRRWNSIVKDSDDVYILGDFVWTKDMNTVFTVVDRLKGRKHLITGNHDGVFAKNKRMLVDNEELIVEITPYKELILPGENTTVVLCHYPIPFFKNSYHGWYHFYGHVHSTVEWDICEKIRATSSIYYGKNIRMLNVGCMMTYMGYQPRTFKELSSVLEATACNETPKKEN